MISTRRAALQAELQRALKCPALRTMPERLTPPAVIIHEGNDFVTTSPDLPFGSLVINWHCIAIVALADNNAMIESADAISDRILTLSSEYIIEIGGYSVDSINSQPFVTIPFTATETIYR